jgi:hypothetical protein
MDVISLDTWIVLCLTTIKFEPSLFSVSSFTLANVANIYTFMILFDFCLLPEEFCNQIVCVHNFERHMQITDRYVPW